MKYITATVVHMTVKAIVIIDFVSFLFRLLGGPFKALLPGRGIEQFFNQPNRRKLNSTPSFVGQDVNAHRPETQGLSLNHFIFIKPYESVVTA
jgi:hypothetical protein